MKNLILITIGLIISIPTFGKSTYLETNSWNDFEGKMDSSDIQLSIFLFENGKIRGNYCYQKNMVKIELHGHLTGNEIELTEIIDGKKNGCFHGKLFTDNLDRFDGKWKNKTKSKERKFELNLFSICNGSYLNRYSLSFFGTTSSVENFMKKIKTAVINDNKNWLSHHICYPIVVNLKNVKKVSINNELMFLENYEEIIHENFKEKINKHQHFNMFVNWKGAMIGNGEIWISNTPNSTDDNYDYCITTIITNNLDSKEPNLFFNRYIYHLYTHFC